MLLDGIADWTHIAYNLNQHSYNDILTFELAKTSKPGRRENDAYNHMSNEEYIAEAYKRACRFAAIKMRNI